MGLSEVGRMVDDVDHITGPIPDSLGNLVNLENLSLRGNRMTGTIPDIFESMPKLLSIDLSFNELTGPLTSSLGTLTSLIYLSLEANHLSGSIPRSLLELPHMEKLYISANRISGSLPPDLKTSESFKSFFVFGNCIEGDIPKYLGERGTMSAQDIDNHARSPAAKLAKLSELTHLDLSLNPHDALGWHMQFLFDCTKLQYLDIHSSGTFIVLTPSFGQLTNLEYVNMSNNTIRGVNLGDWIGQVQKLRYLDISWPTRTLQCQVHGVISEEIGKLKDLRSLCICNSVIVNMTNVCLTGTLPNSIGNLFNLEYLDVSKNQLEGLLPTSLGNLKKLTILNLRKNRFESFIPEELGGLEKARVMLLPRNNLVGQLPPALGKLEVLQMLDLSNNNFNGSLPPSMGYLRDLEYLDVSGNRIDGSVPPSFDQLTHLKTLKGGLKVIRLSSNMDLNCISGELPGSLKSKGPINVHANPGTKVLNWEYKRMFAFKQVSPDCQRVIAAFPEYGFDDVDCCQDFYTFQCDSSKSIVSMILPSYFRGDFQVNGPLPSILSGLKALTIIDMASANVTGPFPTWLTELPLLREMDLSENSFEGPIPSSIGTLNWMKYLLLGSNKLNGSIPDSIGNMTSLMSL
ncbi:hypothetical protein HDU76_008470 [Blyttiomyces sp. JEL0837]|nr:hypothetical protein HDU76_008470 [Blyttiomyces sp. JEL0837]